MSGMDNQALRFVMAGIVGLGLLAGVACWRPVRDLWRPCSAAGEERRGEATGGAESSGEAASAQARPAADPKDVESLDAIVAAIYDVISGPPGRGTGTGLIRCLRQDARLIAVRAPKEGGKPSLVVMTPKGLCRSERESIFWNTDFSSTR